MQAPAREDLGRPAWQCDVIDRQTSALSLHALKMICVPAKMDKELQGKP